MIIHNENGHAFPLVRLNYKNITVPRTTDDIEPLVSEYFNRCISSLLESSRRSNRFRLPQSES